MLTLYSTVYDMARVGGDLRVGTRGARLIALAPMLGELG